MIFSVSTLRGGFAAAALALIVVVSPVRAEGTPSALITSLNEHALPVVNAAPQDGASALAALIEEHVDVEGMLKRAIGRRWTEVSAEQATALKTQTVALIGRSYASAMRGIHAADIDYRSGHGTDTSASVVTTIRNRTPVTEIGFRLKRRSDGWKVIDVVVSGVSIVGVYRANFDAVLAQHGVDGLIAALQERNS